MGPLSHSPPRCALAVAFGDVLLYKVHYLQWTGQKSVDKVLGLGGLTLLIALTALGARLAFRAS